ncbi:MAG: hypothetical protein ACR2ML_06815 [Solirubrobacteraceae bacterium]
MRARLAIAGMTVIVLLALPAGAAVAGTGGSSVSPPQPPSQSPLPTSSSAGKPVVPGSKARLLRNGLAAAPANAPEQVKNMIWAANKIQSKPYVYGGGHGTFPIDRGYDCSGTVSYALYYGGVLDGEPRDAVGFFTWGEEGQGTWVTVYANGGHAFIEIAGLRLDTSAAGDRAGGRGPRWRKTLRDTSSFRARRWPGL